jgi:hypothetical protein
MNTPSPRQPARKAPPELLVLQKAEDLTAFVLARTARWPKAQRFTLLGRHPFTMLIANEHHNRPTHPRTREPEAAPGMPDTATAPGDKLPLHDLGRVGIVLHIRTNSVNNLEA